MHTCKHAHTYPHAFIALAGVLQSCQQQRPVEEEEDREEEACVMPRCDWPLPYQRGRAKVRDWWGRSCRLIIKAIWAAVSLLLSCFHCICVSLFSLPCYLASEVAGSGLCGGQKEGGSVSCQRDSWTGRFNFPQPPVFLLSWAVYPSLWQNCLHLVDLTAHQWHLWRRGKPGPGVCPPVPPPPSPPLHVDDLCFSVSSPAAAQSTHIFH